MADATFLHIHELNDLQHLPELDLALFRYHNDFNLYASDSDFPPSDHLLHPHSVSHEDDLSDHFDCASISVRELDDFSEHDSISNADLFDRENQVNFVMDLFQQRVEQSQVMGYNDLDSEALDDSIFGFFEGNSDVGFDGLGVDLGFGIGIDVEPVDWDDNCLFMGGRHLRDHNVDDEDDLFFERMASVSINGERPSLIRRVQTSGNGSVNVGFESDSDEEESDVLEICINSEDERDVFEANDDGVSISLFRDSLQLDDHRDTNECFEWEEVDDRVDERDVLTSLTAEDERTVSVSVSPTGGTQEEEDVSTATVGGWESLEWQVLLSDNNLGNTMDGDHAAETYLGEQHDYFNTVEYDPMFGQFVDNENSLTGRPPAAKSVVQNLPSVVFSEEDVDNDKPLCAICIEDFNVGGHAKKLACGHRYHGDCIIPWLGIRNTCPVCRYECPTDAAPYEYRGTRGSGGLRSERTTQILFEP